VRGRGEWIIPRKRRRRMSLEFEYLSFGGAGDLYAYGTGAAEPVFVAHASELPRTPAALIEALRAVGLSDGTRDIPAMSLNVAERLFC
jgi:hypothetical protein